MTEEANFQLHRQVSDIPSNGTTPHSSLLGGDSFHYSFSELNLSSKNKGINRNYSPNSRSRPLSTLGGGEESDSSKVKNVFKRKIVGNIFGQSAPGEEFMTALMYQARNPFHSDALKQDDEEATAEKDPNFSHDNNTSGSRRTSLDQTVDSKIYDRIEEMNPRQQLAVTIRNWCMIPNNHLHVIKEGGVHALVALTNIDDLLIRECCASAFFDLSSNRQYLGDLLALGASTGVITLSMQLRSLKVSRLCAMTLCNLTMHSDGEPIMAKDGALIALMILLGTKGHRLLPICVQALYNLTCIVDHYKEIERILKALINIPPTSFDHYPFLVRALVNCSRFSWIRLRMIEDGAVSVLPVMIQSLATRENKVEFAYFILSCLRNLSESPGCRGELLIRGSIEILNQLLQYSFEEKRNQKLLIKVVHNLLLGTVLSNPSFDVAVKIVTSIINHSEDEMTIQYAAACINIFSLENMRSMHSLAVKVVDVLPILLESNHPITQYYAVAAAGQILFSNLIHDMTKLEELIQRLGRIGARTKDKPSIQVLAITFAKLCQEPRYLAVLEKYSMIDALLELLLSIIENECTPSIKEACSVAVSRVALKADLSYDNGENMHILGCASTTNPDSLNEKSNFVFAQFDGNSSSESVTNIDGNQTSTNTISSVTSFVKPRRRVPKVIYDMLESDNVLVLISAISSARILGQLGLYHKEFSSDIFYLKVAKIVMRHKNEELLLRMCCAVLAVFSYDSSAQSSLSDDTVMNVLFSITKSDDILIKKLIATTLCNISVDRSSRHKLIERDVVQVIGHLSGATSEIIQELCAKCICNLTFSVELHATIIKQNILEIILMISLVRSVGIMTKRLCVRSLLNLIRNDNIAALRQAGAVRVFGTLSTTADQILRNMCARGFLLFTITSERCEELIQRRSVLQALCSMVKSKSSKSRILVGLAACNLLSFSISQKTAIAAGALSVLKIISTMPYDDLKEATARVIISIIQQPDLHGYLTTQPIVPLLIMMSQQSSGYTFDCAISALSAMSQHEIFRNLLIDKGSIPIIVNATITGNITSIHTATEICRFFCYLSYNAKERSDAMIKHGHIIFALHAINKSKFSSDEAAMMIAITVRNLSFDSALRQYIIHQDGVGLLHSIIEQNRSVQYYTFTSALITLYNLSLDSILHQPLLEQGFISLIYKIVSPKNRQEDVAILEDEQINDLSFSPMHKMKSKYNVNPKFPFIMSPSETSRSNMNLGMSQNVKTTSLYDQVLQSKGIIAQLSTDDIVYITKALELVSKTSECCQKLVTGNLIDIIYEIYNGLNEDSSQNIAKVLVNVSSVRHCREELVEEGACDLLIKLASTFTNSTTQSHCSVALGYLSDLTTIREGVVESMLRLSLNTSTDSSHANDLLIETLRSTLHETNQSKRINSSYGNRDIPEISPHMTHSPAILVSQNSSNINANSSSPTKAQENFKRGVKRQESKQIFFKRTLSQASNRPTSSHPLKGMQVKSNNYGAEESILVNGELNYDYRKMETTQMLVGNYTNVMYHTTAYEVPAELGGTADEFDIQLSMPSINSQDGSLLMTDRLKEMINLPIHMDPLPKDYTAHDEITLRGNICNNVNKMHENQAILEESGTDDSSAEDSSVRFSKDGSLESKDSITHRRKRSPTKKSQQDSVPMLQPHKTKYNLLEKKKLAMYKHGISQSFAIHDNIHHANNSQSDTSLSDQTPFHMGKITRSVSSMSNSKFKISSKK